MPEKFEGKPYSRVLTLGTGSLPICFMKRFCPLRSRGFVGPLAWTCIRLGQETQSWELALCIFACVISLQAFWGASAQSRRGRVFTTGPARERLGIQSLNYMVWDLRRHNGFGQKDLLSAFMFLCSKNEAGQVNSEA